MLDQTFDGVVRLFPLPDLVIFPNSLQPLHIFEPRYVAMLEEALATDQLIAMALLRDGLQSYADGKPDIHDTVCLGRVVAKSKLEQGHYNILLEGMARGRIECEIEGEELFRKARILLPEESQEIESEVDLALRTTLLQQFKDVVPSTATVGDLIDKISDEETSLGDLSDAMSFVLPLSTQLKIDLLSEYDIEKRALYLSNILADISKKAYGVRPPHKYPPDFSLN